LSSTSVTEAGIREWCCRHVALLLEVSPEQIGADVKFARLGLDSANSVHLMLALEEQLGIELDPEMLSEYPTIAALAHQLAIRCGAGKTET
jgi:acyl carrier protein